LFADDYLKYIYGNKLNLSNSPAMNRFIFFVFALVFVFYLSGCKKCDCFDSAKFGPNDFIGTWKGSISTFKDNKTVKKSGEIVIYSSGGGSNLAGIINMDGVNRIVGTQFNNGFWYFDVICNDTLNPECNKWDLTGFAVFTGDLHIDFNMAGNECGKLGKQFVSWEGGLDKYSDIPDSATYYNFGKQGNTWTYIIIKKSTDTCILEQKITDLPSAGLFNGTVSNSCGWQWQNKLFYWYLDPVMFSINDGSGSGFVITSFPIDVAAGRNYSYIHGSDTTQVMLVSRDEQLTVPAGKFNCTKFKIIETADTTRAETKTTYFLWLNNQYGIIKKEVSNPIGPNDISTQVLLSKNF